MLPRTADYSSIVRRALSLYHSTVGSVPSVETVCQRLNVSRGHFNRVFRSEVGVSPGEYVIGLKLQRACRAMEQEPDLPLDWVARQAGYSSAATMIRQFKGRYGQTPHRWRKARCRSPGSP